MELQCLRCRGGLEPNPTALRCALCGQTYPFNRWGFAELLSRDEAADAAAIDSTTPEYAEDQHASGARVVESYLQPLLRHEPFETVLDIGCGVGAGVARLASWGYDAYGVDLPGMSRFWAEVSNDPKRFFCCNALELPFAANSFDIVYSLGVIEHIGTVIGHCTLRSDFNVQRERYAREIVRITKPGGRIIIACPNKSFPLDIQHGPGDEAAPAGALRSLLFNKTGINFHRTWGRYHLLSHAEVRRLFCDAAGARDLKALPLDGYFAFGRFKRGFLKPFGRLAELYVERLPTNLRATVLNPYVMVQIHK